MNKNKVTLGTEKTKQICLKRALYIEPRWKGPTRTNFKYMNIIVKKWLFLMDFLMVNLIFCNNKCFKNAIILFGVRKIFNNDPNNNEFMHSTN